MEALLFLMAGIIGFGAGYALFSGKLARTQAEKAALAARLDEQPERFKTMAASILEDMNKRFSSQSEKKIGDLLNPLQLKLNDFQKLVIDQGKEQFSLKSEIQKIVLQADSLTKALRGDVKAQGNWGEVILERILEESALRKDADYFTQGSETGTDGNRLRPDVVVRVPGGKHIIVDSKVSLTAYERYCSGGDEAHLADFLRSVKNHVNGLEQKRYQDIEKLGAPDFVLMFMPIEGAFSLAVQRDPELHAYAWGKKIVIVCPSTLFATLQTVASLWRIERQSQNAEEIARQGGALYDKFAGFVEDMEAVGAQLARSQASYDNAMKKLSDGKGNLISRVENLKALGLKTTKNLTIKNDEEEPLKLLVEG